MSKKELPRGGGVVIASNLNKTKIILGKDGKEAKRIEQKHDNQK